jgi:uncharacterized sulfatase
MSRPNILLITSDQQHWQTLGCVDPDIATPNLDRLANAGTLFTRAYCPNPTCTPTRASLITGKYPSQHGAWSLGTKLPESEPTVGEDFQRAGYRTSLIGKAHFQPLKSTPEYPSLEAYPILQDLEYWKKFHGPFYGFEHVELARNHADEAHVGQHYALWLEEQGCRNWRDYFQPPTGTNATQRHRWLIPEEFHYNRWIAERTNARLEHHARAGENFFLWASFFDPHPPYLAPQPWDTLYDPARIRVPQGRPGEHDQNPPHFQLTQQAEPDFRAWQEPDGHSAHGFHSHRHDRAALAKDVAVYYGMVSLLDKYVGVILDRLAALGLAENTVVVFTSDHGHFYGQHNLIAKGPFHYEDLVRVPLIARWPGHIPAGRRTAALQSLVDLPATFLALAGQPVPRRMTGKNQGPVWLGQTDRVRDHVLVENHHQPTTIHARTYIDARYKLTVYRDRPYGELFDLQTDPGEFENRWDDLPLRSALLAKLVSAELAKEPIPMPRIAGA